ncbi:PSY2 [Candida metapsilosis]|uniref:Serine/threonine-protein phosphatase 4 regulatory subunit 3 n=1 Tax=Candida metapsilosis TaxID=273372 RepID=A0A8H8DEM7_9ASCO|nr:PSY2 [Candida metapsilosis]
MTMVQPGADDCEYFTPMTQSKKEELLRLESAGKTPRRVKVYLLDGEDWIDNGTGFCVGEIDEDTKVPYFLVRKESKNDEVILKSNLEGNIQYQRQQDTLIVWTDPSGSDLALSFQETEGCADLCDFIIKVQQGNYSPHISLYYVISRQPESDDITELVTGPVRYPPESPTEENIISVLESLNQGANSQFTRSSISDYLVESKYFDKLLSIFEAAESQGNTTVLQHLSDITKLLLSYNEPSLLEDMLSTEKSIHLLAGVLEYDSSSPGYKAGHRVLFENTSFKTVIPINELELFKRDHSLTILKEMVLPKVLDDSTIGQLNSMIYENQVKVLEYLQTAGVLEKLFEIYESGESVELKRDGVKMLHQYVIIAKSIQKHDFFASLVKPGLFAMVKFALGDTDEKVRIMGTELIVAVIDQNVALTNSEDQEPAIDNSEPPIRPCQEEAISSQQLCDDNGSQKEVYENKSGLSSFGGSFLSTLCDIIVSDGHMGMKYQAFEALKTLLDPAVLASMGSSEVANESEKLQDSQENGYTFEANIRHQLKTFYTKVAPKLFAKITALGDSGMAESPSAPDSALFSLLCEFVIFGAREHNVVLVKNFLIDYKVFKGVVTLLSSPCKKVLKLHIVRCLRSIILLNDDDLTDYMVENEIFKALFHYFESVVNQDDMCSSACLDFLNIIRTQSDAKNIGKRRNFKLIARYLSEHHAEVLRSVSCMKIGPDIAALVGNDFNETESTTLGICGETDLEQLGIHESFIRNGFSCQEDIEDLSLTNARPSINGSIKENSSQNGLTKIEIDKHLYDTENNDLDSKRTNIGNKRPHDSSHLTDPHDTAKRRSLVESENEEEGISFDEKSAAKSAPPHKTNGPSKDFSKTETSVNQREFEAVKGTAVEASGNGTHSQ